MLHSRFPLAIYFTHGSVHMTMCGCVLSHLVVSDSATLWTVVPQAPLSMGFSRQEYWSGLPFPPPGDLPDPGIEPKSSMAAALTGRFFTTEPPRAGLATFNSILFLLHMKKPGEGM